MLFTLIPSGKFEYVNFSLWYAELEFWAFKVILTIFSSFAPIVSEFKDIASAFANVTGVAYVVLAPSTFTLSTTAVVAVLNNTLSYPNVAEPRFILIVNPKFPLSLTVTSLNAKPITSLPLPYVPSSVAGMFIPFV